MTESVGGPAPHSPKLSITSLALALVALLVFGSAAIAAVVDVGTVRDVVLVVAAVAGVILGIGAVLTGVVARRRVQRGNAARGGAALAGIVLGAVTAVLPAIVLAGSPTCCTPPTRTSNNASAVRATRSTCASRNARHS